MISAGSLRRAIETRRIFAEHRHALGHPWCWPTDPSLVATVRDRRIMQPEQPSIGEVLLVSVASNRERAGLWCWSPTVTRGSSPRPFASDVAETLPRLRALVGSAIGVQFAPPAKVLVDTAGATPIFQHGGGAYTVLEGTSFGLALALGAASQFWLSPIPSTFAALAALGDDGTLRPVNGLREKIAIVGASALSVARIVVARTQVNEAMRCCAELAPHVQVVGHEQLRDVLEALARECLPEGLPPVWISGNLEERLAEAAHDLFDLARNGCPLSSWRPVAVGAERVAEAQPANTSARILATLTAAIARRHLGEHAPLPWPFAQDIGREDLVEEDWQLMAHVVQAAADAGLDEAEDLRERARAWVGRQRLVPMLVVLGAVQRSYGIARRYIEASELGAELAARWRHRRDPARASYAVCEWLRTTALVPDADHRAAEEAARWILNAIPHRDDRSGAHVRMALGMAWSVRGRTHDEIATVVGPDAAPWKLLDPMEFLARTRVWHRTLWRAGRHDEARALREELPSPHEEPRVYLVELEAQILAGVPDTELAPTLRAFRAARPQALRWLLDDELTPRAQALRIVNEYAY